MYFIGVALSLGDGICIYERVGSVLPKTGWHGSDGSPNRHDPYLTKNQPPFITKQDAILLLETLILLYGFFTARVR